MIGGPGGHGYASSPQTEIVPDIHSRPQLFHNCLLRVSIRKSPRLSSWLSTFFSSRR